MNPRRIKLSRAKGWRMPENTVKVDRSTKWGNPFVVGRDGTREECVKYHALMLAGMFVCASVPGFDVMREARKYVGRNLWRLKGKNLACWCPLDAPCHADVLLELAAALEGGPQSRIVTKALASLHDPLNRVEFSPPATKAREAGASKAEGGEARAIPASHRRP